MMVALAACGTAQTATNAPESSSADSAAQPVDAAPPAAASNPLCDLATQAEVQAVIGGSITKIDVIDVADLTSLDCVYLDPQDFKKGLSIQYTTTERLVKTNSQWSTTADYFAEWTRGETPVAGLGEGAAWVDITNSLWVLKGDTVVEISTDSVDTSDAASHTAVETLAGQVVARLP